MSEVNMIINSIGINRGILKIDADITCDYKERSVPKLKAVFTDGIKNRRLPLIIESREREGESIILHCRYSYFPFYIFHNYTPKDNTRLSFELLYGGKVIKLDSFKVKSGERSKFIEAKDNEILLTPAALTKKASLIKVTDSVKKVIRHYVAVPLLGILNWYFRLYCKKHPVVNNRVTFMSGRRLELGGNSEFVYDELKNNKDLEIKFMFYLQSGIVPLVKQIPKFMELYATSRVIIIDDYFRLLNLLDKPEGVKIVQLWHACGAFKTFGFSRIGKEGGPLQASKTHRTYDGAIVSSKNIINHYAEGFGLSTENIIPSGVPRTDIILDKEYAENARNAFYEKYPQLRDKKILLFAPTFRGNGQQTAYYPTDIVDFSKLYEELGGEWAFIIKLHPFCKNRFKIDEKYGDYILDLSFEDELNDLLFVTDLVVTDYSSVVFEASLLSLPMLFLAYDLEEYIELRDFYYDFESFVPGKIVRNENELLKSIKNNDFESEKVEAFRNEFFDEIDGKSTQRVAKYITDLVRGSYE
ncbi:MAG: CDP-glycerol glycerophosphotransferase family protein [Eubacterium sp.]|nr:CDP-glycerol glycerophosphotransferase family protein [Eubacterium sp.]